MEKITNKPRINLHKVTNNFKKNSFEIAAWLQKSVICGIDEVGRGCLAGPVVTAAIIVPPNTNYKLLKDSKTMSEKNRLLAAQWITQNCWYGFGIIHHRLIDQHNIWQATLLGMKKAVVNLLSITPYKPVNIVVDAMPLNLADTGIIDIPVHYFIKGESKSMSIAAASILAKVKRDKLMQSMATAIPGYSLEKHKGYGTKIHRTAIYTLNSSIIHRNSFLSSFKKEKVVTNEYSNQQTIC